MRYTILTIIAFIWLASCQPKQKTIELTSTIDRTLQIKATSMLENKLTELNALSGQAIVMEVQTGHIKAMVGLERKDSASACQLARTSPKHMNPV